MHRWRDRRGPAAWPGRPAHPHASPRTAPRRSTASWTAPDRPRCHRHHGPRAHRCGGGRPGDRPGSRPAGRGHRRRGGDHPRRPPPGAGPDPPVKSYRSMRTTIAEIHDQGGLAIPAHPLVPYPLCAQARTLRACSTPPTRPSRRTPSRRSTRHRSAGRAIRRRPLRRRPRPAQVGNSDAHALDAVGIGWTSFPGRDRGGPAGGDRRGHDPHHGTFHETLGQLGTFRDQLRKRGRDARDEALGRVRQDGTGRDHGYPGGRQRPPRYDAGDPTRAPAMKIGLVCPYIYPEAGGVAQHVRFLYENLRLPATTSGSSPRATARSARPRATSSGSGSASRVRTNGSVGTLTFSPRYIGQVRRMLAESSSTSSTSTSRSCRSCRCSCCASPRASTWPRSTPTPASRRRTSSAAGS